VISTPPRTNGAPRSLASRRLTPRDQSLAVLSALLITGIFLIDLRMPQGVALGILYVIPMLIVLRVSSRITSLVVATVCTFLIAVGAIVSPPSASIWMVLTNRALSIFTLWVTVGLAFQYQLARAQVASLRQLLPICASCKSLRGVDGSWKPVDRYVEALSQAVLSESVCPDCIEEWYPELYPELSERYPSLSHPV
jgi:MFS family permease